MGKKKVKTCRACHRPLPPPDPIPCPVCETLFVPEPAGKARCSDECDREARRRVSKRRRVTYRGLKCPWCRRTDREVGFHGKECSTCRSRAVRNGRCSPACEGRPLRVQRRGEDPSCEVCWPRVPSEAEVKVSLVSKGRKKLVRRSPKTQTHIAGRTYSFSQILAMHGEVVMLVGAQEWDMGRTRHPRAVKGFPCSWALALGFESSQFVLMLEDLCHYLRIGEANPVTVQWWTNKFRPGATKASATRGWERFKKRMRDLRVPMESVASEDGSATEVALKIDRKRFIPVVLLEGKRRREAKGIFDSEIEAEALDE